MRNNIFLALFILTFSACSKDDSNSSPNNLINDCSSLPYRIGTVMKNRFKSDNRDTTQTSIFTLDTTVNSKTYIGTRSNSPDDKGTYLRIDEKGDVYLLNTNPSQNGSQDKELLAVKINAPIGTTWTWGNTSPDIKHDFKIISTTETFTLNGKTYINGIAIEDTWVNYIRPTTVTRTYFCGIGFTSLLFKQYVNGNLNTDNINLIYYQY
jgi:hypothetical protein